MSRIAIYQKQVEEQKKIPSHLVEINKEKKYVRTIGQSLQSVTTWSRSINRTLYWVNTRELNRELYTR